MFLHLAAAFISSTREKWHVVFGNVEHSSADSIWQRVFVLREAVGHSFGALSYIYMYIFQNLFKLATIFATCHACKPCFTFGNQDATSICIQKTSNHPKFHILGRFEWQSHGIDIGRPCVSQWWSPHSIQGARVVGGRVWWGCGRHSKVSAATRCSSLLHEQWVQNPCL